jgi:predicted dinucleotide-binding enzyme
VPALTRPDKIGVMRYIVIGAGAIGGTIGGRLAQAGHEVVLVARGPHLDALRARGTGSIEADFLNGEIVLLGRPELAAER